MESPPAPPAALSLYPATLSKRQHALHELMSSERAYASDLALILEVHIPLAQGPMTADDIKVIFNNISELAELSDVFCEALQRTIGSALDDPDATDDKIGELFLRYAPELEAPYKAIYYAPSFCARPPHCFTFYPRAHGVPPKDARSRRLFVACLGSVLVTDQTGAETLKIFSVAHGDH
ncbi:DH domain-containing protein [Mycena venus]|uniref:DH domain-containing protein n=1 Tax=Mycena venus TaxID=2733690 RepID=A0A8H6YPH7_9AGAR|nr:DH domain-containing protein [Mycena venus]